MWRFAMPLVVLIGTSVSGPAADLHSGLPSWVQNVDVTSLVPGGTGAITLSGNWLDTCIPDTISASMVGGNFHVDVTHPGINVGCGDAITPWSLSEEFGPVPGGSFQILGNLIAVDPANRAERRHVSGPDLLFSRPPRRRAVFHGIGTRPNNGYVSAAFDVSHDGNVVVGHNHIGPGTSGLIISESFAWSPGTGMFPLGILPGGIPGGSSALGVSADGNVVVGESSVRIGQEAYRWTLGSGLRGLGGFMEPPHSRATATSRHGQVVVGSDEFFGPLAGGIPGVTTKRAFRWTHEDGLEDLGQLFPGGGAAASDVSAVGDVIVGTATQNPFIEILDPTAPEIAFPDISEPFLWTRAGGMVGLGHLPMVLPAIALPFQRETNANAVSANGKHVVGKSRLSFNGLLFDGTDPATGDLIAPFPLPPIQRAYIWNEETGMVDLGDLADAPEGFIVSAEAVDVSGDGSRAVGMATIDPPPGSLAPSRILPFFWDRARGMRALVDVLREEFGLGTLGDLEGWSLGEVTAISDDGRAIVGTGTNPQGHQEAWRVVLDPDLTPGDADLDGRVMAATDGAVLLSNLSGTQGDKVWVDGDFTGDRSVTAAADGAMLLSNLGNQSADAAAVPEPSSLLLLGLALAVASFCRCPE